MIAATPIGTCQRCGAELLSLHGLALTLANDARRLGEATEALDCMKLALPAVVPATLRDAAARWPRLAQADTSHARACREQP